MKLYDYLLEAAKEAPDRVALEFMGQRLTYEELAAEARQVAAGLASLGIGPAASVAVMLPNVPQFVSAEFGILMSGNILVPFNVLLQGPEINYLVTDSNVRVILTHEAFLPSVEEGIKALDDPPVVYVLGDDLGEHRAFSELLGEADGSFKPVEVDEHAPIMTIYTSGTTGKPKGAQLSNLNVISNLEMAEEILPPRPDDKWLCVLPLFHVFALNAVMNAAIKNRMPVVLHPMFQTEACVKSLAEDDITLFAGVPTMYFYILKYPEIEKIRFPKLRICLSGGSAMPVEVLERFEQVTGCAIYEGYGLTETTVSVCCNRPDGERKVGSIGKPFKGAQMKIVDDDGNEVPNGRVGEVVVKSPNVMLGYLNKPEETARAIRDGWFYTGDLGHQDDDGFFYIVDRKKDMIIKGGYNIYPREIEEVLYELSDVSEAAIVGVYDEAKGEQIRAVMAFKPGTSLSEEAVRQHVEGRLAKYKWPLDYIFLPELPKGPTGKILKRKIRRQWAQWNRDRVPAK